MIPIFYFLTSFFVILCTVVAVIHTRKLNLKESKKSEVQKLQPNIHSSPDYEKEILYAEIVNQFEDLNQKILNLKEVIDSLTKAEILSEIETLKNKISIVERNIDKIKTEELQKKQDIKQQIEKTLQLFSNIKQILQFDYDNLLIQKDTLQRILKQQELEYENIVSNFTTEIRNLTEIINDLKTKYPEELFQKLKIEVTTKTKILENLQQDFSKLEQSTQEKISFLDGILHKKSTEIKNLIDEIKKQKESELRPLINEIENLREKTKQLDEEIKLTVAELSQYQQSKAKIISELKSQLEELKIREVEVNNLVVRENFLKKEIEKINKEYEELQKEYQIVSLKKAEEIREIEKLCELQIENIKNEWKRQKEEYILEISRLNKRQQTLKRRKERLANIKKALREKLQREQKTVEEKLAKEKINLKVKTEELQKTIRDRIQKLEKLYSNSKIEIERLKFRLSQQLQHYNDKISELKKRSQIREERVNSYIKKLEEKYMLKLNSLNKELESVALKNTLELEEINSEKNLTESKIASKKEHLEYFQTKIFQIMQNISQIKDDTLNYEKEVRDIENKIYNNFDGMLETIKQHKEQLIEKFNNLLNQEDTLITEISKMFSNSGAESLKNYK